MLLSALGMQRTFDLRHVSQDRRRWPVLLLGSASTPSRVNREPAAFSIGAYRKPRVQNTMRQLSRGTCATFLARLYRLLLDRHRLEEEFGPAKKMGSESRDHKHAPKFRFVHNTISAGPWTCGTEREFKRRQTGPPYGSLRYTLCQHASKARYVNHREAVNSSSSY